MSKLIEGWLTSEEAAKIIGVATQNMTNFKGCDRVKRVKVGARYMYNEADVIAVAKWRASEEKAKLTRKQKSRAGKATAARVGIRLNDDKPTAAQLERNRRKVESFKGYPLRYMSMLCYNAIYGTDDNIPN